MKRDINREGLVLNLILTYIFGSDYVRQMKSQSPESKL